MQDILLQIWHEPMPFNPERGPFRSWLAVVSRHRALDLLRRRRPHDSYEETSLLPLGRTLNKQIENSILLSRVFKFMAQLPASQRQMLRMAFSMGLSHQEIAEYTGLCLGTVKSRIRVGLISLKRAMAQPSAVRSA
jgi:RNA polymerase sigma-70 factor, ECF subfamily